MIFFDDRGLQKEQESFINNSYSINVSYKRKKRGKMLNKLQIVLLSLLGIIVIGFFIYGNTNYTGLFSFDDFKIGNLFSKSQTFEGELLVVVIDDFDNNRAEIEYFISNNEGIRELSFENPPSVVSGTLITVVGTVQRARDGDEKIQVKSYTLLGDGAPRGGPVNPNLGQQRAAVVLLNFDNNPTQPITVEEARRTVFDETYSGSIASNVREYSYNRAWLTGDVFGWYTTAFTCGLNTLTSEAVRLGDAHINFQNYNRLIIVFPSAACGYSGVGYVGIISVDTAEGRIRMSSNALNGVREIDDGTGIHELGHNFELMHANDWECGSASIGAGCSTVEYGNLFDVMGTSAARGHYSAAHKEKIGWFEPSNVLRVTNPGTYVLEPIETPGSGLKSLKIPTTSNYYYVEYKRRIGMDAQAISSTSTAYDGAMININRTAGSADTQLLDLSPNGVAGQSADSSDVVLKRGQRFVLDGACKAITTVDFTDTSLTVNIENIEGCGAQPFCGNNVVEGTEQCDGPSLNGQTCVSRGFTGGTLSCSSSCTFVTSGCTSSTSCTDSDGGNNHFIPGTVTNTAVSNSDICLGNTLREYNCNPDGSLSSVNAGCSSYGNYICSSGACVVNNSMPPTSNTTYRVFVTSANYTGNIGGIAGADLKCLQLANNAGLGGEWKAWISKDSASSPSTRFYRSTTAYKRVDGATVANNWADLTDGSLISAINKNEFGQTVAAGTRVWTSVTSSGGARGANYDCGDWTGSSSSVYAYYGRATNTNSYWTADISAPCTNNYRLYCFEQPSGNTTQPVCGNGAVEGTEQCDGSNLNGQSCTTRGFT